MGHCRAPSSPLNNGGIVIEPGTTVEFAYNTSMSVNNGGTLISAGTPDNPIIYTSDSSDPWYGDYYCPLYIDETASASTKITYNYIEYAEIGIWVMNNRLDTPIENNYLYSNSFGILEYGTEHTDIYNNLIYASYYYAIEVHMSSYDNQADSGSHILVQNNTCDYYQDVGIIVFGVANSGDSGQVNLSNNIVSGSNQYGLVLANGYMFYTLVNTGYYGNTHNTYTAYDETNPVIKTTMPYVNGTGMMPICYLNPNSVFVNASDEYIEQTRLIGKTTDISGFPDSNKADLGFHYPNWHFSNAGSSNLTADFDNNYRVDFNDLSKFVDYWLYDYNDNYNCWAWDLDDSGVVDFADLEVIADYWLVSFDFVDFADFAQYWQREVDYRFQDGRFDLNGDGLVNFEDFAMFADQWQQTTDNSNPLINITISGDTNNLSGNVGVTVNVTDTKITRIYLLVDGEKYVEYSDFEENPVEYLKTQYYRNGRHEAKIIAMDGNHMTYCSETVDVNFYNVISSIRKDTSFRPGQPFRVVALGEGNYNISVYDIVNETMTYSNNLSGGINIAIPATAFPEEYGAYDFKMAAQSTPDNPLFKFLIRRKFSSGGLYGVTNMAFADGEPSWTMRMVISIADEELQTAKEKCWQSALRTGVKKGLAPGVIIPEDGDDWFRLLRLCLTSSYCKIWYHLGHGAYRTGFQPWNPDRTFIATPSGRVFSYLRKDLNPVPSDYQNVWGYENCHSIAECGLGGTDKMIWTQINACYSARNPDFAYCVGVPADDPIGNQIYIGWNDSALVYDLLGKYNQFEGNLWKYLGQGYNLNDAFDFATSGPGWNQIVVNFMTYGVISWQFVWFRYPNIN